MAGWAAGAGGRAARVWGGALAVTFAAVGFAKSDREAIAFGVGAAVATALTRVRRGGLGRLGLALLAADTFAWMAPAAVANAGNRGGLSGVAIPAGLAALALGVLLLALSVPPLPVLVGGAIAFAGALLFGAVAPSTHASNAADATVTTKNIKFVPDVVTLDQRGSIEIRNDDLFWHTFSIGQLGIDVRIPTGARRTVTIDARPGTYRFVCRIPGHEQAAMVGELTIGTADS